MTRLIIILLAVFLILTFLRSFIRRYRMFSGPPKEKPANPGAEKNKKKNDDDNIVDAKFEEIK